MSETNPLLNKESVQGAAKHIEGLLDSKGVISKSQKEEASQENASNEQETNLHQVIVNGEKIDVDLEELKAGYQKDADYRRKTEELAIEKRELKAEEDRLKNQY